MTRAALLDENGVFLRLDELGDKKPTKRHLPQITECDLPPGQYKWVPDTDNPSGGSFWPMKILDRMEEDRAAVKKANIKASRRGRRVIALSIPRTGRRT